MKKDYIKLDYLEMLQIFSQFAVTDMGKEKFLYMQPVTDKTLIETAFEEARKASYLLERLSFPPLEPLSSIRLEIQALCNMQTLSIPSLLHLGQVLRNRCKPKSIFFP